jgi:hypothetical protein
MVLAQCIVSTAVSDGVTCHAKRPQAFQANLKGGIHQFWSPRLVSPDLLAQYEIANHQRCPSVDLLLASNPVEQLLGVAMSGQCNAARATGPLNAVAALPSL